MVLTAGQSSGYKNFQTTFTPVQVMVYNNTDADIYFAYGNASTDQIPANARKVASGKTIGLPYTRQAQTFTLFWVSASPLSKNETVVVEWADQPLSFNFAAMVQQVQGDITATISGPVTVTGTVSIGNSPTVNISGTGNTVQLAAGTTVSISGTVSVSGTVSIGNSPTVSISGTGNTVQLASGTTVAISGTVTVSGTVSIGNSPTVSISGAGNTVQLAAGTSVSISGSVTVTGTVSIGNSPTVSISGTGNTVQLATGTSVSISGTVSVSGTVNIGNTITVNISGSGNQVIINNSTSSPGYVQGASGSFDTQSGFNTSVAKAGSTTLVSAGNYITQLQFSVTGTSSGYSILVKNGSQVIDVVTGLNSWQSKIYTFGEGVINNGITITEQNVGPVSQIAGYGILRSSTPRQRTATIV